jgi:Bacterial EndoU nuclease
VDGIGSVSVEEYVASLPADEQEVARHVLLGGFNKRGRPVGFHHAPNGVAPPGRRIEEVVRRYSDGSYQAVVSFWEPRRGWVRKEGEHTMFPDGWRFDEVLAAGCDAYDSRVNRVALRWRSAGRGIPIGGYRRDDGRGPATFFPDHGR